MSYIRDNEDSIKDLSAATINGITFYNQEEMPTDMKEGDFWYDKISGSLILNSLGNMINMSKKNDGSINFPYTNLDQLDKNYEGLKWFANELGLKQQLFCYDGFVLVASNFRGDSLLPTGTDKNSNEYRLDRNNTQGALGEPAPDKDYIIGSFISNMPFKKGRIATWGAGGSDNHTWEKYKLSYTNVDTSTYSMTITWNSENINDVIATEDTVQVNREIVPSDNAKFYILDSTLKDASLNASVGQATIGGAGVKSSSGDRSEGTYTGHGGSDEGSGEGNYYNDESGTIFTGYTTWIGA